MSDEHAIEITDANYKETIASGVALIDFWAPWCGPCRMQGPVIQELAKTYAGRAVIGKCNVDQNPSTAGSLGIQSIPTLIVTKDGSEIERLVGVTPAAKLTQILDANL